MLDFLTVLARRWRILVAFIVLGVAAGALLTKAMTPSYRAESQLFVSFASTPSDNNAISQNQGTQLVANLMASYVGLADSPLVLDPVIKELNLDTTATKLGGDIHATVPTDTVLLLIDADDDDPKVAAQISNAVANQLAVVIKDIAQVNAGDPSTVRVTVTQKATTPGSARTPIPALNIAIGLFAGLGLGLAGATIREALDTTIKDEGDVEDATGLPTLAAVPINPDISTSPVLVQGAATPAWSESYRKLRTNISYLDPDNPPRTLLVASALQGDGKTVTAANLAASLAQSGRRVVLVEADLRRPGISKLLGLVPDVGVTTAIAGKASLADVTQESGDFSVITSGPIPPNPSELLGSKAFRRLVEELLEDYDNVVIDTPPLIAVTDAAVASLAADAVIIVCQAKRTKRPELRKALFGLRAVDAQVAGVVINRMPATSGTYYQYAPRDPGLK